MAGRSRCSLVVSLCACTCVAAAAVSLWPAGYVRTEDHNGDGRPDVWRAYDRHGQLSEVAVDTNFDGRSDVHEYYERGFLVRRESDRDFNDQVDLVEEFDPATSERVRSVEDVNYDGTADLLVLFQGGEPVFRKWAHPVASAVLSGDRDRHPEVSSRTADDQLEPLEDPFRTDHAMRAVRVAAGSGDCVGLSTSGGLPDSRRHVGSPLASSSGLARIGLRRFPSTILDATSSRGPPLPAVFFV
jgi:hypothetical protein